MARSKFKLTVYGILIVVLLLGLVRILINTSGNVFNLELVGFSILLLLSLIGFCAYKGNWGERVLFFVFLLYLLNLVLLWHFVSSLYVILLLLALIGFMFSLPKKAPCSCGKKDYEEPYSEVFDPVKKEESEKPKAKHSPGKYVASSKSNVYHEPKCNWAQKIAKVRQIWFKDKEEAWEKGYKAHSCVK